MWCIRLYNNIFSLLAFAFSSCFTSFTMGLFTLISIFCGRRHMLFALSPHNIIQRTISNGDLMVWWTPVCTISSISWHKRSYYLFLWTFVNHLALFLFSWTKLSVQDRMAFFRIQCKWNPKKTWKIKSIQSFRFEITSWTVSLTFICLFLFLFSTELVIFWVWLCKVLQSFFLAYSFDSMTQYFLISELTFRFFFIIHDHMIA